LVHEHIGCGVWHLFDFFSYYKDGDMITLKDFMQTVDYKITEGSDYCWTCYGANAYTLSYWNQDHNGHSLAIIFDTHTHNVYEVQAHDYKHNRAYRLINPDYKDRYDAEAMTRGVEANEAWDDVNYVDLEIDEDFHDKASSIISGEDYDTRIDMPLRLDNDALFELMKRAHEQDITLNQLIEDILRNVITLHETGTLDPIDFPAPKKIKRKKSKK
jgi:hypothetical protein